MKLADELYYETHEDTLRQEYEDYILELVAAEGGTVEAMREREPFDAWVKEL